MPLFLLPLLIAIPILLFIPISIRVIHGELTEIQIEIQPLVLTFKDKGNDKKQAKKKKENKTREIIDLIRLALPHSRITVSKLDITVLSSEIFSLYRNTALIGAALYPLLSYVGLRSKEFTIEDGALDCTPSEEIKTKIFVDISFELRLYKVIYVLTKHFLLKRRRAVRARRNKGFN